MLDRKLPALQMLLNIGKKLFRIGAIDDPMIEAEREIRHMAYGYVILTIGCGQNHRPFFNLAHAKDRNLRLIDDRRAEQSAEDAGIRNRECAAGNFIGLE